MDYDRGYRVKETTRKSRGMYYTSGGLAVFTAYFLEHLLKKGLLERSCFYDPAAGTGNLLSAQRYFKSLAASDISKGNLRILKNRGIRTLNNATDFLKAPLAVFPQEEGELFIIMNPPYRGKSVNFKGQIGKKRGTSKTNGLSPELLRLIEKEKIRSSDLCSFFILKASLLLQQRGASGYLGVFSPTNWLTAGRSEHEALRKYFFRKFSFLGGFIVNGREFFPGVTSGLPVAFSVFKYGGVTGKDTIYADLSKHGRAVKNAKTAEERTAVLAGADRIVIPRACRVSFRDYIRAINAQTGDDTKRLFDIVVKGKSVSIPKKALSAGKEYFLAGIDRNSGYAVAVKPIVKKSSGCQFCIKRELLGPALAWHYLWDYQQTSPVRFYNAVPVSRKYAYTYIEEIPLRSLLDISESKAVRKGATKSKELAAYAGEWLKHIGEFRGLWFFFYALSVSKTPRKISQKPEFRNMPVWCPKINIKTRPYIKEAIALGLLLAKKSYNGRFKSFSLVNKGVSVASAEAYFSKSSNWSRKAKLENYLLNGINNDIIHCCNDEGELLRKIDVLMQKLYPEQRKTTKRGQK